MRHSPCLTTVDRLGGAGHLRAGELSAPLTPSPQIMPIRLRCPECQALMQVTDHAAGNGTRCPQCESVIPVPVAATRADVTIRQRDGDQSALIPIEASQHADSQPADKGEARQVRCPRCRLAMYAIAGTVVDCPGCQAAVRVPLAAKLDPHDSTEFENLPPPALGSTGSPPPAFETPSSYRSAASPPDSSDGASSPPAHFGPRVGENRGHGGVAHAERLPSDRETWYYVMPGAVFLLFALFIFLLVLARIVLPFLLLVRGEDLPPPAANGDKLMLPSIHATVGTLMGTSVAMVYFLGGLAMIRRRGLTMARLAAIVACIPCFNAVILMPIGIWACILTFGHNAKADFNA